MKSLLLLCLVGAAFSLPSKPRKLGNPDEWGDYYQGDIRLPLPLTEGRLGNPDEWGDYYQGDIRLPLPVTKNGILDEAYRWTNGVVPYEFHKDFSKNKIPTVKQAMEDYAQLTNGCITFVERTDQEDYIRFIGKEDSGCWSSVGKQGGRQKINYPQWCIDTYGSVLHEMYHALGFFHEQSRTDRDDYVTIQWQNIEDGHENNFEKYPDTYVGTFGVDYDYGSVMHYSAYAFSKNHKKTIVTKEKGAKIGQREGLSESDLTKLMNMYNCPSK